MLLAVFVVHTPMMFADDGCDESDENECMVVTGTRLPGSPGPSFGMDGMMQDLLRWPADMATPLPPAPPVDDGCDYEDCITVTEKRITCPDGAICSTTLPEYHPSINCFTELLSVLPQRISGFPREKRATGIHNGLDLAVHAGTGVFAAKAGVVIEVIEKYTEKDSKDKTKNVPPTGNLVRINYDDGTQGVYLHLEVNSVVVEVGDRVNAGSHVANANNTGRSKGNHLHYTQYTDDTREEFVNPMVEHGNCG